MFPGVSSRTRAALRWPEQGSARQGRNWPPHEPRTRRSAPEVPGEPGRAPGRGPGLPQRASPDAGGGGGVLPSLGDGPGGEGPGRPSAPALRADLRVRGEPPGRVRAAPGRADPPDQALLPRPIPGGHVPPAADDGGHDPGHPGAPAGPRAADPGPEPAQLRPATAGDALRIQGPLLRGPSRPREGPGDAQRGRDRLDGEPADPGRAALRGGLLPGRDLGAGGPAAGAPDRLLLPEGRGRPRGVPGAPGSPREAGPRPEGAAADPRGHAELPQWARWCCA